MQRQVKLHFFGLISICAKMGINYQVMNLGTESWYPVPATGHRSQTHILEMCLRQRLGHLPKAEGWLTSSNECQTSTEIQTGLSFADPTRSGVTQ